MPAPDADEPDAADPVPTLTGSTQTPDSRRQVVPDGGVASFTGPARRPGPELTDELPDKIGRYHVLTRLGAGGMGVVFAAYDPELDRKVAVKLLRGHRSGPDPQIRLLREAQALARLSHPHVVQVHDAGVVGGHVFVAMEFVRGQDLLAWLSAAPRTPAAILAAFDAAGRGLAAAHDAGLVHRDFKPENVLVGDDGRVRVADFGLARPHTDPAPTLDPATSTARPRVALAAQLTVTGALLGTPAYMSPEQHAGAPADARSDQFSYCVALWEALYRRSPFAGERGAARLARALQPPPADSRVPRRVAEILQRGLAVDPAGRFPDMHALLAALARDPARARRRWLGAAVLATMAAGTAFFVADRRAAEAGACTGAAEALADTWNDPRREAVAAALRGAPDPDLATRLPGELDAYARAWQLAHRDACLDHRRGEQPEAWLAARMRCLDRRRVALDGVARVLAAGPPDAVRAVAGLPAIADCSDPERARAETEGPGDPALARTADSLAARLLQARAEHDAGDLARARSHTADAATAARDAGLRPQLAEALLLLGRIDGERGESLPARDEFAEAGIHAVATGREAVAAEALARQLHVDGQMGRIDAALALAPLARAVAEHLPAPGPALARLENNLGTVHLAQGQPDAAREQFVRATAAMAAVPDPDPIEQAHYWANLARVTREPAARGQAFAQAVAALTGRLGPRHLLTFEQRRDHARHAADPQESAAILADLCPQYPRLHPDATFACGQCFYLLGHARALAGDPTAAVAAFDQVAPCLHTAPRSVGAAAAQGTLRAKAAAFSHLLADRPAEALEHADAALRQGTPFAAHWWVEMELADAHLARARALRALGRLPAARDALALAIPTLERVDRQYTFVLPPRWLTDARSELAELDARLAPTALAPR